MNARDSLRSQIYEDMLRSRYFDEYCEEMAEHGEPTPHLHSGIGQEALMVAPVHALEADDEMIYTHRGYGHLIARGIPIQTIMEDMLFKATGSNGGFGGVMHVNDPTRGVLGRNGVFGTRFTIASGLGLSSQYRGSDNAVLCWYGEAAGARGPLFEAMNLMSLWDLPVVLIAENNGYSISARTEDLYAPGDMSSFAEGFNIPRRVVDGNDPDAVHSAVASALNRARDGDGPTVIEGMTYRLSGHRPTDDERYRSRGEVEENRRDDPVTTYRAELIDDGALSESEADALERRLESEIRTAMDAAKEAPEPTPDQAFDCLYHDGGVER